MFFQHGAAMKRFTFKGVLDNFRQSVSQPTKSEQPELIETLKTEHCQLARVSCFFCFSAFLLFPIFISYIFIWNAFPSRVCCCRYLLLSLPTRLSLGSSIFCVCCPRNVLRSLLSSGHGKLCFQVFKEASDDRLDPWLKRFIQAGLAHGPSLSLSSCFDLMPLAVFFFLQARPKCEISCVGRPNNRWKD